MFSLDENDLLSLKKKACGGKAAPSRKLIHANQGRKWNGEQQAALQNKGKNW